MIFRNCNSIRIEHGQFKNVSVGDGFGFEGSRITTSANRCVLFNILLNKFYINFQGLKCGDFCCGSGIVGFEFWSLGAEEIVFLDCDRQKLKNIEKFTNKIKDKFPLNYKLCYSFLPKLPFLNEKLDIIFLDPPYNNDFINKTIQNIAKERLLKDGGMLILETTLKLDDLQLPIQFKCGHIKELKNNAHFYFLNCNT